MNCRDRPGVVDGVDMDSIISMEDELLRGIPPELWNFRKGRISTGALGYDDLSVDWTKYRSVEDFTQRRSDTHGVVSFHASLPREFGLTVRFDPRPPEDSDNDAHTCLFGEKSDRSKFSEKGIKDHRFQVKRVPKES